MDLCGNKLHHMTPSNTYTRPEGGRRCRACRLGTRSQHHNNNVVETREVRMPRFTGDEPCAGLWSGYYSHSGDSTRDVHQAQGYAVSLCLKCPMMNACAEYGIHHEKYGTWGGLTEQERDKIRRQYGIKLRTPEAVANLDVMILLARRTARAVSSADRDMYPNGDAEMSDTP